MTPTRHYGPSVNSAQPALRGDQNPAKKIMLLAIALIATTCSLTSTHASEFGRLFYTPEQRSQLERQRITGVATDRGQPNSIMVNGVIQKQGGNRIVWLNGEAQTPVKASNNPASIDVAVPGKTKHVQVKVGQRLMLETPVAEDGK